MDPQLSLVCLDSEWKQKITTESAPTVLPALPALPAIPPQSVRYFLIHKRLLFNGENKTIFLYFKA